jgi:hypothetical protein
MLAGSADYAGRQHNQQVTWREKNVIVPNFLAIVLDDNENFHSSLADAAAFVAKASPATFVLSLLPPGVVG